jgi:hypothetical protein
MIKIENKPVQVSTYRKKTIKLFGVTVYSKITPIEDTPADLKRREENANQLFLEKLRQALLLAHQDVDKLV